MGGEAGCSLRAWERVGNARSPMPPKKKKDDKKEKDEGEGKKKAAPPTELALEELRVRITALEEKLSHATSERERVLADHAIVEEKLTQQKKDQADVVGYLNGQIAKKDTELAALMDKCALSQHALHPDHSSPCHPGGQVCGTEGGQGGGRDGGGGGRAASGGGAEAGKRGEREEGGGGRPAVGPADRL